MQSGNQTDLLYIITQLFKIVHLGNQADALSNFDNVYGNTVREIIGDLNKQSL